MDRRWFAITVFALMLLSGIIAVYGQEASLTVLVRDPFGNSLGGIEVQLIRGDEVRRFVTNSTGYAEFRHLEPGEYILKVIVENVNVGEKLVRIPEDREVDVTAQLSIVEFKLLNLDGEPVKGLRAELRAGSYSRLGESDDQGVVSIERVPYSGLEGVGIYSLTIKLGDLVVYEGSLEIAEPRVSRNITLPLVSLRLTIANLEGEPVPRISLSLSSQGYSTEGRSERGIIVFKNLPSSDVKGVGPYRINASMRVERGDMPIYFEERSIERSLNISLIADLMKLVVRVVDEGREPIKGVRVVLSNDFMANFTSSETDERGKAVFENIPLSRGKVDAGTYIIQAIRAGRMIGELRTDLDRPGTALELIVRRGEARLKLLDYHGNLLSGCLIKLVDELSGDILNATTNDLGEAVFKLFYGPYMMEVYKDDKLIRASTTQLTSESLEIKLNEVNFPLSIRVVDALGKPIASGYIEINAGDRTLTRRELTGEPINLDIPYPLELRCDIYANGRRLLHRKLLYAHGPQELVVELKNHIFIGGLIELETIALVIMLTLVAVCIISSAALILKARRKRLIT